MDTHDKGKLKKELGVISLVAIGVGSIVGSGIFALPSAMAATAGPALILAILIAGLVTFLLAMAYAELGSAFPLTGGPYSLPRLAMGDLGGFLMGWGYLIYLFIGTAAIIDIFVVYLGFYVPGLSVGQTLTPLGIVVALAALWTFTAINLVGVKWGALYSVVTTFAKLVPLVLFGVVGLMLLDSKNFAPFMPLGFKGVTIAVTIFFWAYTGFEAVVVPSGEVRNPHRTIPLAMMLTMAITIAAYALIGVAFVGMIDWPGLGLGAFDWAGVGELASPLSNVSMGHGLLWLAALATVGAVISTAGAGGNWVLIQGRVPFAMATNNLFWKRMSAVHPRFGTPVASIIFTSILTSIVLIAIPNFPSVALIASITAIVPYAAAAISVPILRRTKPDTPRPFRLPLHRLVTLAGFMLATMLIYWASWPWTVVGAALILAGYPAFLIMGGRERAWGRTAWVPVYIIGIAVVSFLGDPHFTFQNFTPWEPLGILLMPHDLIVLAIFSTLIFAWAYRANVRERAN